MTEDKYLKLRTLAKDDDQWVDNYDLHLWDEDEDSFDELRKDVRVLFSERDALIKEREGCPFCNPGRKAGPPIPCQISSNPDGFTEEEIQKMKDGQRGWISPTHWVAYDDLPEFLANQTPKRRLVGKKTQNNFDSITHIV